MRSFAALLVGLALAVPTFPQSQFDVLGGVRHYQDAESWLESPAPGSAMEVLGVGHVVSRWDTDVLVLRGGSLVLIEAPTRYNTVRTIATGITGALVLPGFGDVGLVGLDGILAAGPAGAEVWRWDGDSFYATSLDATSWIGATRLRLGALQAGVGQAYALAASQKHLLRAPISGTSISIGTSITLAGNALEILPIHWDADAVQEIAVQQYNSIQIRADLTGQGNVIETKTGATLADRIAVSRGSGGERDVLAWYRVIGNASYLVATNSNGDQAAQPLGPPRVARLTSFDFLASPDSEPAREDLILSDGINRDVYILLRGATAPTFFPPSEPCRFTFSEAALAPGEAPYSPASATAGDVDGDGDLDAVFALRDSDDIVVQFNGRTDEFLMMPAVNAMNITVRNPGTESTFSFLLTAVNPGATDLEVEVWATDQGVRQQLVSRSLSLPGPGAEEPCSFPLNDDDLSVYAVFEIMLREVQPSEPTEKFPAVVYLYSEADTLEELIKLMPNVQQFLPPQELPQVPIILAQPSQGGGIYTSPGGIKNP